MSNSDNPTAASPGLSILPGGTMRIEGGPQSRSESPQEIPNQTQALIDDAPVHQINDHGTLAVQEDGGSEFRGALSVQLTPSPQEQSLRNAEKERDMKVRKLEALLDPQTGLPKQEFHWNTVKALKASIQHIQSEIDLMVDVYSQQGARAANQSPSFAPTGGAAPQLQSGIGVGQTPTLEEVASDPQQSAHVRRKAAKLLERIRD